MSYQAVQHSPCQDRLHHSCKPSSLAAVEIEPCWPVGNSAVPTHGPLAGPPRSTCRREKGETVQFVTFPSCTASPPATTPLSRPLPPTRPTDTASIQTTLVPSSVSTRFPTAPLPRDDHGVATKVLIVCPSPRLTTPSTARVAVAILRLPLLLPRLADSVALPTDHWRRSATFRGSNPPRRLHSPWVSHLTSPRLTSLPPSLHHHSIHHRPRATPTLALLGSKKHVSRRRCCLARNRHRRGAAPSRRPSMAPSSPVHPLPLHRHEDRARLSHTSPFCQLTRKP